MTTDTIASSTSPLFEKAEPSAYFSDQDYHRFHERAARYDRENRFFDEDLADLRERGYLRAALPADLGGGGLGFAALAREQRRLAYWAPATALAVNMHLYWTGPATALTASGGDDLGWLLRARCWPPGMANGATTWAWTIRSRARSGNPTDRTS